METVANFSKITQLPFVERMQLFEKLWGSLAAQPADVAIPDWHKTTLRTRLGNYQNTPKVGEDWSAIKQQLCAN